MKQSPTELIQSYTNAFDSGDLQALTRCFHDEASIVGTHYGILVSANRSMYIEFLGAMGVGQLLAGRSCVNRVWNEIQGEIAVACLIEELAGCTILAYATMIATLEGWKFISKSFHAYEEGQTPNISYQRRIRSEEHPYQKH